MSIFIQLLEAEVERPPPRPLMVEDYAIDYLGDPVVPRSPNIDGPQAPAPRNGKSRAGPRQRRREVDDEPAPKPEQHAARHREERHRREKTGGRVA